MFTERREMKMQREEEGEDVESMEFGRLVSLPVMSNGRVA
jgi:hypothetical protein